MNFHFRIGFGIAKQLVRDGAKVMISSRKQDRVSSAVSELENEERGCEVKGVVCHVAKPQHRKNLIEEVSMFRKSTNVTVKLLIIVVSHAAVLSWSEICCGPVIRNEQILTKPQHRKNLIEEVSMFRKSTNVTVKLLIIVVSHAAVLSWSEICCGPVIRN